MRKYLNIKVFFLITLTTFVWCKNVVLASQKNHKKVPRHRRTFKLKDNSIVVKKKTPPKPLNDTKEVVNIINQRGRRNSELLDGVQKTIAGGQDRTDKSLQDIKVATQETAKKVIKTIKKTNKKTNQQVAAICVILIILIAYTYYNDFFLRRKKTQSLKMPKLPRYRQNLPIPFLKAGGCPCKGSGLKCWQKFMLLILFLIAAALLWHRYLNFKQKKNERKNKKRD